MDLKNHITSLLKDAIDPKLEVFSMNTLGGGCINQASKINTSHGPFFLKSNAQCPPDIFLREAESLEALARAGSSLKIPKVLVKTSLGENPAILITEYLEGPEHYQDLDGALGQGLAELHQYTHDQFGFYHDNYCGATLQNNQWNNKWLDFFLQQRIWYLVEMITKRRNLGGHEIKLYEKFILEPPSCLQHGPKPSLIHGDLWSGNYMPSNQGPAIIDPASAFTDREFEFSIMNMFGGFSQKVWDTYDEIYPLTPEWKERSDIYMLYHYLNHYYLFGGGYGQQATSIVKRYV
ncbi:fructosamine kinase family protein [Fulvivirgaceae bacterium BMA10]|uniref:Fructosamine kinase family protein n=1 Tax=Splendidivirga corallicola TaxID=3051826 RepID=A0ABT8KUN5_9BACT|nr:fructosamine kinase family protein [Fulvivirgaceae bacterium BMA10]